MTVYRGVNDRPKSFTPFTVNDGCKRDRLKPMIIKAFTCKRRVDERPNRLPFTPSPIP
jgi:hypothetical protein